MTRLRPPTSRGNQGLAAVLVLLIGCGGPDTATEVSSPNPSASPALLTESPTVELTDVDPPVQRAIATAQAAIRAQPDDAGNWGQLAKLLLAHELPLDAAIVCLDQASLRAPRDPQWPYLAGIWLATRQPSAAIQRLERAVELGGPETPRFRQRLAETLLAEGQVDAAERHLQALLKHSESNAAAWLALGRVHFQRGQLQEARAAWERAQADPRARKQALQLSAQAMHRLGAADEAARLAQLAAQTPDAGGWPDLFVDEVQRLRQGRRNELAVADTLLAQGRPQQAIAAIQQTLQQYPDLGWAWLLLGRGYLDMRDPDRALAALREARARLPEAPEVHFYLGAARLQQADHREAANAFRRAAEIAPDFAEAWYQLARCELRAQDEAAAVNSLRQAVRAKPGLAAAQLLLAETLHRRGQHADALSHAEAALRLEPRNVPAQRLVTELRNGPKQRP